MIHGRTRIRIGRLRIREELRHHVGTQNLQADGIPFFQGCHECVVAGIPAPVPTITPRVDVVVLGIRPQGLPYRAIELRIGTSESRWQSLPGS